MCVSACQEALFILVSEAAKWDWRTDLCVWCLLLHLIYWKVWCEIGVQSLLSKGNTCIEIRRSVYKREEDWVCMISFFVLVCWFFFFLAGDCAWNRKDLCGTLPAPMAKATLEHRQFLSSCVCFDVQTHFPVSYVEILHNNTLSLK